MDKKEKNEYFKNMRNAFDIKSEKWFARQDGIKVGLAEGEARGLAKGRADIARNMKDMGLSPEQIAQATGLSLEAISEL